MSEFLPFIIFGVVIILVALWLWLAPSKVNELPPAENATNSLEVKEEAPVLPVVADVPAKPKATAKPDIVAKAKPKKAGEQKATNPKPAPLAKAKEKSAPADQGLTEEISAPVKKAVKAKPKVEKPLPIADTGPNNLLLIKGLGPKLNTMLGELGITRFDQIANWTETDITTIDGQLGNFAGRITRDQFVDQAAYLAKGDVAGFEAKYGKLDGPIS